MRSPAATGKQLIVPAVIAVAVVVALEVFGSSDHEHPYSGIMKNAATRAQTYGDALMEEMRSRGIEDLHPDIPRGLLLGPEFSSTTTTLGSLEAKKRSLDPVFASLLVRLIIESGADSSRPVGVALSGSFPGLGISVLAALDAMGRQGVLISSLGASMYGANREDFTWVDMEDILAERRDVPSGSVFVTPGGEGDAGGGLEEEGVNAIERSASRTDRRLVVPSSLQEAISVRQDVFRREDIGLLINVGGNQAMLGGCAHASSLPTGLWSGPVSCDHEDRGVMVRMNEEGIPVIHLLNLRGLSERYGLEATPPSIYAVRAINAWFALPGLVVVVLSLCVAVRIPSVTSRLFRKN